MQATANSDYIIELEHITKRFVGITANDDISLSVRKGEIMALLGENGAGKSTLMSMLFGMFPPDEGRVLVRGQEVHFTSPLDASAEKIGMVHQHFKLVDNYTVAENIVLGDEPMNKFLNLFPYVDMAKANRRVRELSDSFGLDVNPEDLVSDLFVSQQQRVEILKMLYRDAEILIFDEPTSLLTPQEIQDLLETILDLKASGKTIILITHKIEEIKKVADRCAILRQGKLLGVYDVKEKSSQELAALMVGHEVQEVINNEDSKFAETVLEVDQLTYSDPNKVQILKGISFSIHSGEIFAIAGVSGNGQEELPEVIAGLLDASGGKILLKGRPIQDLSIRERAEAGLAYIPEDRQDEGVFLDFDLKTNLALRGYYKEPFAKGGLIQKEAVRDYAGKLIDRYDIRSAQGPDTMMRSMSGGNQQKAIVAREIEVHSPLVIFVQPTRGLDIGAIQKIHQQILEEKRQGAAILLISLELDEIMQLADTIGVIYNGELIEIAPAKTLSKQEVGNYMMGVRK